MHGQDLYISSTCLGGIQRLPIRVLLDAGKPAAERAMRMTAVTKKADGDLESLKGITFNRWDPSDPWIYAGDPFHLKLIRVDSRTGKRQDVSTDARLFNFTVGGDVPAAHAPPREEPAGDDVRSGVPLGADQRRAQRRRPVPAAVHHGRVLAEGA